MKEFKPKITIRDFIDNYCKESGVAWEWLSKDRHAVPCDCGEYACQGWAMVPRNFETHNGLPSNIPPKYFKAAQNLTKR